ncbi:unnamed protein product [Vicia faba]|uniref:Uncharacterized protein n=1 Tax=Vicia faba TaxID=3906 RepID=A0AAV1BAR1_VICFA|nr:unnamed protein product [Vicia faba]
MIPNHHLQTINIIVPSKSFNHTPFFPFSSSFTFILSSLSLCNLQSPSTTTFIHLTPCSISALSQSSPSPPQTLWISLCYADTEATRRRGERKWNLKRVIKGVSSPLLLHLF